jgi:hypothetical protein
LTTNKILCVNHLQVSDETVYHREEGSSEPRRTSHDLQLLCLNKFEQQFQQAATPVCSDTLDSRSSASDSCMSCRQPLSQAPQEKKLQDQVEVVSNDPALSANVVSETKIAARDNCSAMRESDSSISSTCSVFRSYCARQCELLLREASSKHDVEIRLLLVFSFYLYVK